MGCTLYAMAFGTCPFESPVEGIMKLAILDANFSFPKNNTYHCCSFSNPFCKFIRMMLRLNIEDRITIDDCIEKTQLLIDHCPKHEVYWGVCSEPRFLTNKHANAFPRQEHARAEHTESPRPRARSSPPPRSPTTTPDASAEDSRTRPTPPCPLYRSSLYTSPQHTNPTCPNRTSACPRGAPRADATPAPRRPDPRCSR